MRPRITALITLITLLCATVALAAPTRLSQQGRLLDGDGAPLAGSHELAFTLHDAETDGNEVWREERVVPFEEGYYSIVLGTVSPLEDLLFASGTVWMQLAVNGVVLSPRQEVVSVPYALRAAVAESVEGGTVDADEIAIGGNTVIDSAGNWLGTPTDWSELTGVPADLSDGDADSDILLGLPCADGFIAKYSASLSAWDCAPDNDSLATLGCLPGEIPVLGPSASGWVCGTDLDTNTQLTEAQVDAFVANNNYSVGAHIPNTDLLASLSCALGEMILLDPVSGTWDCVDHVDNPNSHHSSTSDGLAITPSSITLQGTSTTLTDGELTLGPTSDDVLTAAMLQTLTNGGAADSLHEHVAGTNANAPVMMSTGSPTTQFSLGAALRYCRDLTEGNFTNWRVPTWEEFIAVSQMGVMPSGGVNSSWTSSLSKILVGGYEKYLTISNLGSFNTMAAYPYDLNGVYCVRSEGSVSAGPTMMSAGSPTTLYSFGTALQYCRDLTEGNFTDWRVPTLEEFISVYQMGVIPTGGVDSSWTTSLNELHWHHEYYLTIAGLGSFNTYSMYPDSSPKKGVRCVR